MANTNCAYHEDRESVKHCTACSKPLCEDCIHADFPDYCWSCGYEQEQKQVEEEKGLVYPAFLEHRVVYYVIHKAFAAGGASVLCAFGCGLLLSILAGPGAFILLLYLCVPLLLISYTYGIVCSLVIDIVAYYSSFAQKKMVQLLLYLFGGLLFPYLTDMYRDSELFFYLILSGGTALLFFLLQTARLDKRLVISVGMLSLIVMVIVCSKYMYIMTDLLF